MKKLFLLLGMALSITTAIAQSVNRVPISTTNFTNLDTVSNTATRKQTVTVGSSSNLRIQVNVTKLTGTDAGNVTLLGSQDGITFEPIPSLKNDGTIGADTLKVANIAGVQTHSFIIPVIYHNVYIISYTGTGTMAAKLQSFATEKLSPVYFKQ